MTAVVGLLNKKGVALVADSAVTRSRSGHDMKVTKNGNKMIRVSQCPPICIMVTGSASFLDHPWDIIIREYRMQNGENAGYETVKDCVDNFFDFLRTYDNLWHYPGEHDWVRKNIRRLLDHVSSEIMPDAKERDEEGVLIDPFTYEEELKMVLQECLKDSPAYSKGIFFQDYGLEEFIDFAIKDFKEELDLQVYKPHDPWNTYCDPEILNKHYKNFLKALFNQITGRLSQNETQLIFTGYGIKEEYPSLIPVTVYEGFDRRPNHFIESKDIVEILPGEKEAAICPFAQVDVMESVLSGVSAEWKYKFLKNIHPEKKIKNKLENLILSNQQKNINGWEEALKDYDLREMADLALSLIDLTGFHRILTFQSEGVGGELDVAVITKEEGFTWLSRKSWYHHKDIGGRYGYMGV